MSNLHPPAHLASLGLAAVRPRFRDLPTRRRPIDPQLHQHLLETSPRGVLALTAALGEWIVWRVEGHHDGDGPGLLDAMWAAAVHPSYLRPTLPPPADHPGWSQPGQSAVWHVQGLHLRTVEDLVGLQHVHELRAWALHVLPKPVHAVFLAWLASTATLVAARSPATPETRLVLAERRPTREHQHAFRWGRVVARPELDGTVLDDAERDDAVGTFLGGLDPACNPLLCPPEEVATNRRWRPFLEDLPPFDGEPYAPPRRER